VLAVNDNTSNLRWGVAYLGGRHTILTTDSNATPSNINLPEEVLCDTAVGSASNTCREIGFFRADFDDDGGAAADLWAIQTGVGDIVTGATADGLWQPWNPVFGGYSSDPTSVSARWSQVGRDIRSQWNVNGAGTSDAVTATISLPAKAHNYIYFPSSHAVDNTTVHTTGMVMTTPDSVTLTGYPTAAGGAWTASNNKYFLVDICYEVGPVASFIE
jgi:hypothetical protein